ncbi:MAG: AAA family ATPase, partial [Deltaproteobacteria bacterium]|nr:AAA family ATPase [Deltaproteobacteria bacterium]
FREHTETNVAVLAPTGVAAANIRGQTIHSFFRFRPDVTVETAAKTANRLLKRGKTEVYQKLDALLIDEISMVRADLLDCVDAFLRAARRKKSVPFGGVKMIFIGDLYQLPPVVRSAEKRIFTDHYPGIYFFDSRVFSQIQAEMVELEKVYRQSDGEFIRLLNAVRNNSLTPEDTALFNRRFQPRFDPKGEMFVTLTATNDQARFINSEKLASLGAKLMRYHGEVVGEFANETPPTDEVLGLKEGAQVMLLNNDPLGRWVNGTMAVITRLKPGEVRVRLETGGEEEVGLFTWNLFRYDYDAGKKRLFTEEIGSFTQYPIRLAWAVTIHKSQGKTFERVIIDVGRGTFATGQMYVALSRCRTLTGMVLKKRLERRHILVDYRIVKFLTGFQYGVSEKKMPLEEKMAVIERAIAEKGALSI